MVLSGSNTDLLLCDSRLYIVLCSYECHIAINSANALQRWVFMCI